MKTHKKIFIDGAAGTTGLDLQNRIQLDSGFLSQVEIVFLAEENRKDLSAKYKLYQEADLVVLCLPDEAALEMVAWVDENKLTCKIIDTSTAHRINPSWEYGFPEIPGRKDAIKKSYRVANPGCYAIGIISLLKPLTEHSWLSKEEILFAFAVSGYSGGGKMLIAEYEGDGKKIPVFSPYAVNLSHKHLPEICQQTGLEEIYFQPSVINTYRGMLINIPIKFNQLKKWHQQPTKKEVLELYQNFYGTSQKNIRLLTTDEDLEESKFINPLKNINTNELDILLGGNNQVLNLFARLDNLGKGAAGTALQNIKLMLDIK